MSIAKTSVVTAAARMLQDSSYARWDLATIEAYVALAEQRSYELRPDLWMSETGSMQSLAGVSGATIYPDIIEVLAHYVAYLALSEDDADRGNTKSAADHLGLFNKMLLGG